jgi:hypothetical protein
MLRSGFVFDTSAIPDANTIDSAKLKNYVSAVSNLDDDAYAYVVVCELTLADNDAFADADYNDFGTTAWSDTLDIGDDITTSAYNDWTLNATGIAAIDKTGDTVLGFREGHDITDNAIGTATNGNSLASKFRANAGMSTSPRLEVVHSAGAAATGGTMTTNRLW